MIENHISGLMYGFMLTLIKFNILVPMLSFSEVAASFIYWGTRFLFKWREMVI